MFGGSSTSAVVFATQSAYSALSGEEFVYQMEVDLERHGRYMMSVKTFLSKYHCTLPNLKVDCPF